MSVCCTLVSWIALALLTTMSMPPKCCAVWSSACLTVLLLAHVDHQRQRLAARLLDLLGGGVDRAGQLGVRRVGLGGDRDVGAVARGAQRDRKPDAARSPGDEQRLALERHVGPPGFRANGACGAPRFPLPICLHQRRQINEARHAAHRHPSPDRDLGRRAGQQALLHRHDGHAHGEEDRQPGRHQRLSPVLRRRAGAARHRPHLLRLAGAARAARHAFDRAHRPARRRPGDARLVEGAARARPA